MGKQGTLPILHITLYTRRWLASQLTAELMIAMEIQQYDSF